jgi:Na+-translocating ferredoxin:NAD+ oxidoreductase RnfG subunit
MKQEKRKSGTSSFYENENWESEKEALKEILPEQTYENITPEKSSEDETDDGFVLL